MSLKLITSIELPAHQKPGGFDHAAYYCHTGWLYVAHTANNALDVIDCASDRYLRSIPDLAGVAGVLASEERGLVFTSNRSEDTISFFNPEHEEQLHKVAVGNHPNGLALDPGRELLLSANVGSPDDPDSYSLSIVDIEQEEMVAAISAPGRTRWAVFDPWTDAYYVNLSKPSLIAVIPGANPSHIAKTWPMPASGPHGLDLDDRFRRLYCTCDARKLLAIAIDSGAVQAEMNLSGSPDVVFVNSALRHLYVASGDPGVIDVFDIHSLTFIESVPTGPGAHTFGFDPDRSKVYALLPETHTALVFEDKG
jgi:DNA-binding beta-propeller fold protein YncE